VLVLLAGAVLAAPFRDAAARAADPDARARPVAGCEGGAPMDEIERWWGVAGSVLCGGEIWLVRRLPAIGMNPYLLAAGIGGCILALIDVRTTQ